jgi:hypothetical protein
MTRLSTRTHLSCGFHAVDSYNMTTTANAMRLRKVQDDIEMLLARRPTDDFSRSLGYRSLVALEAALLEGARDERGRTGSR